MTPASGMAQIAMLARSSMQRILPCDISVRRASAGADAQPRGDPFGNRRAGADLNSEARRKARGMKAP